jgi:tRNA1(Val) A37 N6-methylase TrmN6
MGAGCGVVSWQLLQLLPETRGVAVEIQPEFGPYIAKNLQNLPVEIVRGDIRELPAPEMPFDLLVSNPPYFRVGRGKLSKNPVKAAARHTLNGTLPEWVEYVSDFLTPDGGVALVYPSRFSIELISQMQIIGFYVNDLVHIASYGDQAPKLVCLYFSRKQMEVREEMLVLYEGHRKRTKEAIKFLSGTLQESNFL